jgi:glycosyltransferase involved in cell wall biosynthesis
MLHLVPGETGGSEIYARNLLRALHEAGTAELVVFAAREAAGTFAPEMPVVDVPVAARKRVARVLAEQMRLPLALRRARVDVLHNLFTTAPAVAGVPQVTTVHDLIYRTHPETHGSGFARGLALLARVSARRSRRVLVPSEATKSDVVRYLGVAPELVDVTYEGPGIPAVAVPAREEDLRERFHLGDAPLVLTVSAKRPHKNLDRLLEAIARVDAEPRPILVAPGYATRFEAGLAEHARRLGIADTVRFCGWVDDATLDGLYRAATCFVFPSLAEGFGLPVLEAMLRDTPVACSRATSLPEVAGQAALYFDPLDIAAIADAMERLLRDSELREHLVTAGREQARRFSWERTADATLRSYELALKGS